MKDEFVKLQFFSAPTSEKKKTPKNGQNIDQKYERSIFREKFQPFFNVSKSSVIDSEDDTTRSISIFFLQQRKGEKTFDKG